MSASVHGGIFMVLFFMFLPFSFSGSFDAYKILKPLQDFTGTEPYFSSLCTMPSCRTWRNVSSPGSFKNDTRSWWENQPQDACSNLGNVIVLGSSLTLVRPAETNTRLTERIRATRKDNVSMILLNINYRQTILSTGTLTTRRLIISHLV